MPEPGHKKIASEIIRLTRGGNLVALEEFWLEKLASIPTGSGFINQWIESLSRVSGGRKQGETLIFMLLEDRVNREKWKACMRLLVASLRAWPSQENLRPLLIASLRGFYANLDQAEDFMTCSGLETGRDLSDGLRAYRDLTRLVPGRVHSHFDWGEGIIRSLDLTAKKVVVDFPKQAGKSMTFEGVRKYLKPLDAGSFLARRQTEPEVLRKMTGESPCELIRLALSGTKGKSLAQADLKRLLTPSLIETARWNSWWNKTREQIKLDPFIDMDNTGGARAVLRIRDKPRTFEQQVEEQYFSGNTTTALQCGLIGRLGKRPKDSEPPVELAGKIHHHLVERWEALLNSGMENQVGLLETSYMTCDLADAVPEAGIEPPDHQSVLGTIEHYPVAHDFESPDHAIRMLKELIGRDGHEGVLKVIRLLPDSGLKTAQFIAKTMHETGELSETSSALHKLQAEPMSNPETYHWTVKWILDGSWPELTENFPASSLIPELISSLDDWHRWANDTTQDREVVRTAKLLVSKIRSLLQKDKFRHIGKAVEDMQVSQITRLIRQIHINDALGVPFKEGAERLIRIVRRDLDPSHDGASHSDPDIHQCTARSFSEKTWELRDLTSNRIPENSREIEDARAEGDLKENAGYQYAKEEQKRLVQQQASLSILLSQAIVVDPGHIDASRVSFGTRFKARNIGNGKVETYTVLGRWETDPEHHVLSIQSPLAKQFLDSKVNDAITVDHPGGGATSYEVLEIKNALESGEWDEDRAKTPRKSS